MKKIIILILIALICLSTIACEKEEVKKEDSPVDSLEITMPDTVQVVVDTEPMLKEAVMALNNLNSVELPAGGFTIASSAQKSYVPSDDSTYYNAALKKRNSMFEKKYSTTLIEFTDTTDNMLEKAYLHMMSGGYYSDIFSIPQRDLGKFITKGVLIKTSSLADADFSKKYYDTDMMENSAWGSNAYAVYGEFNKDIANYYCLYVNRDILAAAGLEMPYAKVKDGNWTWDELVQMLRSVASLDSVAGMASSTLGNMSSAVYKSGGLDYIESGYGRPLSLAYNNASTEFVLSVLRSIGGVKTIYNNAEGINARSEFMNGNSMFYIGTVGEMKTITTMKPDWCILPLPKHSASQESYCSYVSGDHAVTAVFAGTRCTDIAAALDGLNAASYGGYLSDAYYYELIDTSIRDSYALDMMDYICGLKDGEAVNDFSDIYPEFKPYAENALAAGVYNYTLTPESILNSSLGGFEELKKREFN